MGLFGDLYSYRPRVREGEKRDREPLEDWLTECLAAALRALVETEPRKAAQVLALLSEQDADQIAAAVESYGLRVQTQFHAGEQGRPDMVFWLGEWPWMICENKVGCPATAQQIEAYRDWQNSLTDKRPSTVRLEPKVAFVTHYTKPPECDLNALRWSHVARDLCRATQEMDTDSHVKALAHSFEQFLKDQHMNTSYPNGRAMAVAELMMAEGRQLYDLANAMIGRAEPIGDFAKRNIRYASTYFSEGMIYASRMASGVISDFEADISVGLWFPSYGSFSGEVKQSTGLRLSDSPKVFVTAYGLPLLESFPGSPEGWHRCNKQFLTYADFASFEGTPDERGEMILDWTEAQCRAFREWADKQG